MTDQTRLPNTSSLTHPRPDPAVILATDLDGTFLAGSAEHRHQLYRLVDQHPEIRLIFISRP